MNSEAQRIAIAEACGYIIESYMLNPPKPFCMHSNENAKRGDFTKAISIPDYLSDLNAMHEAEKVLHKDEIQWARYRDELHKFYLLNDTFSPGAAQRAEAFLRTIGKWEDTP